MKKTLLLVAFLSVALFASAQETTTAVETDGNETLIAMIAEPSLMMSGSVLDTREMAGFQQSMATLGSYSHYQRVAIAGWTLFAVGPVLLGAGTGLWVTTLNSKANNTAEVLTDVFFDAPASLTLMIIGSGALTAGIVCLGVSYHNLGGHANLTDSGIRERKPLMTFNLQSSRDGLGFAIRF